MERLEREVERDPDAMDDEDQAALQEDIEEDPNIRKSVNIYRSKEENSLSPYQFYGIADFDLSAQLLGTFDSRGHPILSSFFTDSNWLYCHADSVILYAHS